MQHPMIEALTRKLIDAGHEVTEEMGLMAPFGLYRVNGGPELTEMQFIKVANMLLDKAPPTPSARPSS